MKGIFLIDLKYIKNLIILTPLWFFLAYLFGKSTNYVVTIELMSMYAVVVPLIIMDYEEKNNNYPLFITMPIKKNHIVLQKYILNLICVFINLILSIIFFAVENFEVKYFLYYILIISFSELFFIIGYPMHLKFGGTITFIVIFSLGMYSIIYGTYLFCIYIYKVVYIFEIVVPIVSIVLYIASYFLTLKIFNNKVF